MQILWIILLAGDLVVGELQQLKTYAIDFGSLQVVHWDDASIVNHLGDLTFQFEQGDAAIEVTLDDGFHGGWQGDLTTLFGEEWWFYGEHDDGIEFTQYLDEPGQHYLRQEYDLDFLVMDWVAPPIDDSVSSTVTLGAIEIEQSSVPEASCWKLLGGAALGYAFMTFVLWVIRSAYSR